MSKDRKKTSKNDVQQLEKKKTSKNDVDVQQSGGDNSQQADEIVRAPTPPLLMPILQKIADEQQSRSRTPLTQDKSDQVADIEENGRTKRIFKIPKKSSRSQVRKSRHDSDEYRRYGGRGQKRGRSPTPDYECEEYDYEPDYDDYEEYSDEYGDYEDEYYYDDYDAEFSDEFEDFHDTVTDSHRRSRGKGSYADGMKKGKAKPKGRSIYNGQNSRAKDWELPKIDDSSDEDANDGEDPWTRVQKQVSVQLYLRDLAEKEKRSKENQGRKSDQNAPPARQPASAALGAPPVDGQTANPGVSSENTGREPGELPDEDDWYTKAIALATTVYDKDSQKDKKINDSYANIIDEGLRAKPKEERFKMMTTKYKVPENVPNLQVPRTNPEVWENLHRGTQMLDNQVQRVQLLQVNALSVILRIIDEIGTNRGGLTESHLEELTDANRMLSMGFSSLNQVRKEAIRNAMGYPLAKMCGWDTPVGPESLFPDLSKKLKEKDEVQFKLRRRIRYNRRWSDYIRGRGRGRRRGRGGGRVRGRGGRVGRGRGRKARRDE